MLPNLPGNSNNFTALPSSSNSNTTSARLPNLQNGKVHDSSNTFYKKVSKTAQTKQVKPVVESNGNLNRSKASAGVLGGTKLSGDDYSLVRNYWLNKFDKKVQNNKRMSTNNGDNATKKPKVIDDANSSNSGIGNGSKSANSTSNTNYTIASNFGAVINQHLSSSWNCDVANVSTSLNREIHIKEPNLSSSSNTNTASTSEKASPDTVLCPVCNNRFLLIRINDHLDYCLTQQAIKVDHVDNDVVHVKDECVGTEDDSAVDLKVLGELCGVCGEKVETIVKKYLNVYFEQTEGKSETKIEKELDEKVMDKCWVSFDYFKVKVFMF